MDHNQEKDLRALDFFLMGIVSDGILTDEEIWQLKDIVDDSTSLRGIKTYDRLSELLNQILEDNIIEEHESQELLMLIKTILSEYKQRDSEDEMSAMDISDEDRVKSLFLFLKEFSQQKKKIIKHIDEYEWKTFLSDYEKSADNQYVFVSCPDRDEDMDVGEEGFLVKVKKPVFSNCPEPDKSLLPWIDGFWDDYKNEITPKEYIVKDQKGNVSDDKDGDLIGDDEDGTSVEYFNEDSGRVATFERWQKLRQSWVREQKYKEKIQLLFSSLYQLHYDLIKESDSQELVVANGIFKDRERKEILHPLLLRRVRTSFDADKNVISIEDVDVGPEVYHWLLQEFEGINLSETLQKELIEKDLHPMDRVETPEHLKRVANCISDKCFFSDEGEPNHWEMHHRFLVFSKPVFFKRKKDDGTLKAIQEIIENIDDTGFVPSHLKEIVRGGQVEISEMDLEITNEERLAAVGGESIDVFLSKEANREQLEIARRIEKYNAVIVQGPPGTGKTHTIANLMGHFLAEGKSILVTSHTPKALRVLKEKVVAGIESLCVSVLDDSNADMERSIDGITQYMSSSTSFELKKAADQLFRDRKKIVEKLGEIRKQLFAIINAEANCIVMNGEDISPAKAAQFVFDHQNDLSYIPGKIKMNELLPLSFSELSELYRSNENITADEEYEFDHDLPVPDLLLGPDRFAQLCREEEQAQQQLLLIEKRENWEVHEDFCNQRLLVKYALGELRIGFPEESSLVELDRFVHNFSKVELWMKKAAIEGKNQLQRKKWQTLVEQIRETNDLAQLVFADGFGKLIAFSEEYDTDELLDILQALKKKLNNKNKKKIGKWDLLFDRKTKKVLSNITIDGKSVCSESDCDLLINKVLFDQSSQKCAYFWHELLSVNGEKEYEDLGEYPYVEAMNWVPVIERYLNWYEEDFQQLGRYLEMANFPKDIFFENIFSDSEFEKTEKTFQIVSHLIPTMISIVQLVLQRNNCRNSFEEIIETLSVEKRNQSSLCSEMKDAVCSRDVSTYGQCHNQICMVNAKIKLRIKREGYLERLKLVAPQWANAIEDRTGVHGNPVVPQDIEDAWKWKQYSETLAYLLGRSYEKLQQESLLRGQEYRRITAEYVEKIAWYHLLSRTECDLAMQQALQGWRQTMGHIGKGTGKHAARHKAIAKKQMALCQRAVPAWIMPLSKALETLKPGRNIFDVVIVDEASQSDISALAITYFAKKVIIVGDDKQVSPAGVGKSATSLQHANDVYLEGKITNSNLYDWNTSLYDIAITTFQPLMLREHFRCVPEIIGFSNRLSYDCKIKPLRETSENALSPAVVDFRVSNGAKMGKTNTEEAIAIVALLKSCLNHPAYKGKTFGVISLLGDEQVKKIQYYIYKEIDPREIEERQILCGNSANFQGDERDVIFLSLVDSSSGNAPLTLRSYGHDDIYRKRYNVATSRARDQLWVVHSLDISRDLKPEDLRRSLIEYAKNPRAYLNQIEDIKEKSESPFEEAVAKSLVARGYRVTQQWEVGAYRIDMVVRCGKRKVAIECDGERFHSGEEQIWKDLERQTILERLGWQFIRIRGSEFYRDPQKKMENVFAQLKKLNIEPEHMQGRQEKKDASGTTKEVIKKAKVIAEEISSRSGKDHTPTFELLVGALSGIPSDDLPPGDADDIEERRKQLLQKSEVKTPPTIESGHSTQKTSKKKDLRKDQVAEDDVVVIFDDVKTDKNAVSLEKSKERFPVGTKIIHDDFGNGTIIGHEEKTRIGDQSYYVAIIKFNNESQNRQILVEKLSNKKVTILSRPISPKSKKKHEEKKRTPTCDNCYYSLNERCTSLAGICEDYRARVEIAKEERQYWPKYGDATAIRLNDRARFKE